ncbi:MAG TPA: hypothetical protein VFZ93_08240 [Albitalea sp.]
MDEDLDVWPLVYVRQRHRKGLLIVVAGGASAAPQGPAQRVG